MGARDVFDDSRVCVTGGAGIVLDTECNTEKFRCLAGRKNELCLIRGEGGREGGDVAISIAFVKCRAQETTEEGSGMVSVDKHDGPIVKRAAVRSADYEQVARKYRGKLRRDEEAKRMRGVFIFWDEALTDTQRWDPENWITFGRQAQY